MTSPTVSVICVFRDAAAFIGEAMASVMAQDFRDFELILVDDGSRDASADCAMAAVRDHDIPVRLLAHPGGENRGISASRNLGMDSAKGEFVTFIDGDDRWRPDKLSAQLDLFREHPEVGMVAGAVNYWHSWNGGSDAIVQTGHLQDQRINPPDAVFALYPLGPAQAPSVEAMIRASLASRVAGCEESFRGLYDDQVLFAKIMLAAPVWFSSQVWLDYRQHPASCVATAHSTGVYRRLRRDYLDWLKGYVAAKPVVQKRELLAAIAWQRRQLGLCARLRARGARLLGMT